MHCTGRKLVPFPRSDDPAVLYMSLCAGEQNGQVRLAEGRADPGGLWQYGRLEVLINGIWSIVDADKLDREGLSFLRTEAIVACRTLGFTTGVQMLVGDSSPYPAPLTAPILINSIFCGSDAEAFSDCKISFAGDASDFDQKVFDPFLKASAVALTCASPTGVQRGPPPRSFPDLNCGPIVVR